jgi:hypothetical protein
LPMHWTARDTEPKQLAKMCRRFSVQRAFSNSRPCLGRFY